MISVGAVLAAVVLGLVLIFAIGVPVSDAIGAFIDGTIGSPYAIAASLNRSIAFALVGIGFVIANRANLVNVGGEGQIAEKTRIKTKTASPVIKEVVSDGDLPIQRIKKPAAPPVSTISRVGRAAMPMKSRKLRR